MSTVLVIDDNHAVITALETLFSLHDIRTLGADSPEAGLEALERGGIDLVISDMNFRADTTSGEEGVALFRQIRACNPDMPVILLTAWTHLEAAVELVKAVPLITWQTLGRPEAADLRQQPAGAGADPPGIDRTPRWRAQPARGAGHAARSARSGLGRSGQRGAAAAGLAGGALGSAGADHRRQWQWQGKICRDRAFQFAGAGGLFIAVNCGALRRT